MTLKLVRGLTLNYDLGKNIVRYQSQKGVETDKPDIIQSEASN